MSREITTAIVRLHRGCPIERSARRQRIGVAVLCLLSPAVVAAAFHLGVAAVRLLP